MVNFARLRVNMVASSEERVGLDAMVRASRLREGGVAVAAGSGGSGGELAGEMRDLDSDVSALEMSLRRLKVLLADFNSGYRQPINAVYYRNSQLALRIQCFLDFIQSKLAAYASADFKG